MPWQHTQDIPADFESSLVAMCADALSTGDGPCEPLDLAACWFSESNLKPTALNGNGWAAGIFQLMPATARELGWRKGDARWTEIDQARARHDDDAVSGLEESLMREFTQLSATAQLAWAKLFYGAHRGALTSAAACYVATFLPADVPKANDPDHVLCDATGFRTWAYAANRRAFDYSGNGRITVQDLADRIERVTVGNPRWAELAQRISAAQQAMGNG